MLYFRRTLGLLLAFIVLSAPAWGLIWVNGWSWWQALGAWWAYVVALAGVGALICWLLR